MNPFKAFARWLLSDEMSDLNIRIARQEAEIIRQEAEITRLMDMIRKYGNGAADRIGRLELENRQLTQSNEILRSKIVAAIKVHDDAKAPNSTVKRMARLLLERR